jgi:hypothetical protein
VPDGTDDGVISVDVTVYVVPSFVGVPVVIPDVTSVPYVAIFAAVYVLLEAVYHFTLLLVESGRYKVDPSQVTTDAIVVPSAVVELIRKQSEGWSYLKAGN